MRLLLVSLAIVLATAGSAYAQVFASGAAFADIKRFSGDSSNSTLDGTAFGGGARVGCSSRRGGALRWVDMGRRRPRRDQTLSIGAIARFVRLVPPAFFVQSRTAIVSSRRR
jgi:hypothetical protein